MIADTVESHNNQLATSSKILDNASDNELSKNAVSLVSQSNSEITLTFKAEEEDETMNHDSTGFLSGRDAIDFVGSIKGSDIILVLPNGETIFAHSKYLRRNAYFKAHLDFPMDCSIGGNSSSVERRIIKVLPPHTNTFRTILQVIYKHSNDTSGFIGVELFCPLFENATYFQSDELEHDCLVYFESNWQYVIQNDRFSVKGFAESSLRHLLGHKNSTFEDSECFQIILAYAVDAQDEDDEMLRGLMKDFVNLNRVSPFTFKTIGARHRVEMDRCFKASDIAYREQKGIEVFCHDCDQWVLLKSVGAEDEPCDDHILPEK
ncbi:hypothetical protein BCR33DRAFT_748817 [Rhizoclosmatium globosum]|uniref:BTB domain-containing protein n=1 Tax=Rhizoclosmatium globosum TaxID=329046 RepID=A0A1Y2AJJ7_9FUNG|nr:hypothetical protein BCR33DRAFT_748817 [Rhizoclosmatium globosum]|eukprot:ORY22748.1 hypothetical protein BCR33DRAFT_748817 [Rhizoclosmatium globosum]